MHLGTKLDSILVVLPNELWTDKTKEWMNYKLFIELIQNALSQSSEQGVSLLFTCPMLTAVNLAMYSGGCTLCNLNQIESYHNSSKHSPFECKLMEH